jgi:hypothetical protein
MRIHAGACRSASIPKRERFEIGESDGAADERGRTRIHKITMERIYAREDSA